MVWQQFRHAAVLILSLVTLNLILVYAREPAGLFIQLFQATWVVSIKLCLQAADYFQKMALFVFRSWEIQAQHRWIYSADPPRYVWYSVKGAEFMADLLRYLGSLLARGAISYRNNGGVGGFIWPARFVVTARNLFLPDSIERLSFTPTWVTDARG